MTIDEELTTGQTPNMESARHPECSCWSVGKGGCRCYRDDGTVAVRVHFEAAEHEQGGFPRRVFDGPCAPGTDRDSLAA